MMSIIFLCVCFICIFLSSEKCCLDPLPILTLFFFVFFIELYSSLYVLDPIPFQIYDLKIFFSFVNYLLTFHFLNGTIHNTTVFNYVEVKFVFCNLCLGIISKKPLPNLSSQTFTPKFSSKNFIVLVIQITIYFNFFSKKKKKRRECGIRKR
jgi:hypothetical protein